MSFRVIEEGVLETRYVPDNGSDFVVFIQNQGNKAQLCSVGGKARWVVKDESGIEHIYRPQETMVAQGGSGGGSIGL